MILLHAFFHLPNKSPDNFHNFLPFNLDLFLPNKKYRFLCCFLCIVFYYKSTFSVPLSLSFLYFYLNKIVLFDLLNCRDSQLKLTFFLSLFLGILLPQSFNKTFILSITSNSLCLKKRNPFVFGLFFSILSLKNFDHF